MTRRNHNIDVGTLESAELIRLGFRAVPFVVAFPLAQRAAGGNYASFYYAVLYYLYRKGRMFEFYLIGFMLRWPRCRIFSVP